MKGHVGAVMTSGLAVLALALALLQAAVLRHTAHKDVAHAAAPPGPSNRFSAPGGRSGIPWLPFDKPQPPPADREGRSPPRQQQEEHHSPPRRDHSLPPRFGPQVPHRLTA